MISQNDISTIVGLIDKRFADVLDANSIEQSEDNFQYVWIRGIYNDIKEYLSVALNQ
jgi:hypothetical protein